MNKKIIIIAGAAAACLFFLSIMLCFLSINKNIVGYITLENNLDEDEVTVIFVPQESVSEIPDNSLIKYKINDKWFFINSNLQLDDQYIIIEDFNPNLLTTLYTSAFLEIGKISLFNYFWNVIF